MKKLITTTLAAVSALALANCTNMPAMPNMQTPSGQDAAVGAAGGAALGAIIGHQSGKTKEGALLGGLLGGGTGYAVGKSKENAANY